MAPAVFSGGHLSLLHAETLRQLGPGPAEQASGALDLHWSYHRVIHHWFERMIQALGSGTVLTWAAAVCQPRSVRARSAWCASGNEDENIYIVDITNSIGVLLLRAVAISARRRSRPGHSRRSLAALCLFRGMLYSSIRPYIREDHFSEVKPLTHGGSHAALCGQGLRNGSGLPAHLECQAVMAPDCDLPAPDLISRQTIDRLWGAMTCADL